MKQQTKENLMRSSNAIEHYLTKHRMIRPDSLGMAEWTTKGLVILINIFFIIFVGSAMLLGGF